MNDEMKTCTKCFRVKVLHMDFYMCSGIYRSECKACTIKKNCRYQKTAESWKNRFVDIEEKRAYMIEYYAKNKEKFAVYRETFRNKHPEYHKEYTRRRKNEKK